MVKYEVLPICVIMCQGERGRTLDNLPVRIGVVLTMNRTLVCTCLCAVMDRLDLCGDIPEWNCCDVVPSGSKGTGADTQRDMSGIIQVIKSRNEQ